MAVGSALTRGVRTLARREFWTFKVIHAVLGGLLTVTGACGGIFVTEQIKKQIADVDGTIADATHASIRSSARSISSSCCRRKACCSARSRPAAACARTSAARFLQLGFLIRKGPTARMIQELNSTDLAEFRREREEHEKLVEAALPADDKAAWDELLKFEMDQRASCATCTDRLPRCALRAERAPPHARPLARDRDRPGASSCSSSAS